MSKFDEYLKEILEGSEKLARDALKGFVTEATDDAKDFLDTTKNDLTQWTEQLSKGELAKDEFEFLVKAKKDLAQLRALKRVGVTKAQLESFQNALIDLVINTAFKVFL